MSSKKKTTIPKVEASPAMVPKLRFPEFQRAAAWKRVALREASMPVTERDGKRKLTPVSISAGIGFVPQAEKFGRDISGNQYQLYTLVSDGDFVFNKGNSLKFPQGCVYQLHGWGQVAAPTVFICFRLKKEFLDGFFQQCFEQNQHGRQLKRHITSGARSNGLLNISKETFFGVEIPTPSLAEQQKIADCLSSLDDLIAAQARKVEALKAHKKGLMQQLFPRDGETQPRWRFPEFRDAGEWEVMTIGKLCKLKAGEFVSASDITEVFTEGLFPCYGGNGLRGYVSSFTHHGLFVLIGRQGALCGNVNLFHGRFHATEHALVVSPTDGVSTGWLYYALGFLNLNRFSIGQAQPGLSVSVLNNVSLFVPVNDTEQQKIAECLSSLDDLIAAECERLDALKPHKRALMQQLFPSPEDTES